MFKRTPLKRKLASIKKVSDKQKVKNALKKESTIKRHQLFLEIWEERKKKTMGGVEFVECFETGKPIYDDWKENTCIYHHCLLKSTYPQYDLCKENIICVRSDIHTLTHSNIEKTPKIKAETERLYQLHLNGLL